jgi:hypothetical protein
MEPRNLRGRYPCIVLLLVIFVGFSLTGCGEKKKSETAEAAKEGEPVMQMAFGHESDVALADSLWGIISDEESGYLTWKSWGNVDVEMTEGQSPHGAFLKTYVSPDAAPDPTSIPFGAIIVKENYMEDKTLGPVTGMWRIEGYDPDNFDWFWAKYLPDGTLDKNPMGVSLAGRVAKGSDKGCIACHSQAKGDDFAFTN